MNQDDNTVEIGGVVFKYVLEPGQYDVMKSREFKEFKVVDAVGNEASVSLEDKKAAFNLVMAVNCQQPHELTYLNLKK